jgi:tRNA(Arg) A34 adenosine deaminase TadA
MDDPVRTGVTRAGLPTRRSDVQLPRTRTANSMQLPEIRVTHPEWVGDLVDFSRTYTTDEAKIRLAISLARENVARATGGPFGAAIFQSDSGTLISVGTNSVVRLGNSTLHAEMVAFMMAESRLGSFTLSAPGMAAHELYTSCEPCAMCLGAVLWSGVRRIVYAATRDDAARLDFDEGPVFPESYAYLAERGLEVRGGVLREEAAEVFDLYLAQGGRIYNG